jgi:hypothetical protein
MPRKELLGAVVGAQLAAQVGRVLRIPRDDMFLWCDSKNVLAWITNLDLELQKYVHNRVKTIHGRTDLSSWRWVESERNPADHLSRGKTLEDLLELEDWPNGPPFLKQSPEHWPKKVRELLLTEDAAAELKTVGSVQEDLDSKEAV